jgi:NTP pyrophosphatase (non-canonical NTP hydrolase)
MGSTDVWCMHCRHFVKKMEDEFPDIYVDHPEKPVLCVAEEAGEFVGAARRYHGYARRYGTIEQVAEEAADVIIATWIACFLLNIDIEKEVNKKWRKIFERSFREHP